mgnify:CR=1 FL=1
MSSSPFASANVSHTPSFDQNQDSQNFDDLQIDLQALDMDEETESDDIFDTKAVQARLAALATQTEGDTAALRQPVVAVLAAELADPALYKTFTDAAAVIGEVPVPARERLARASPPEAVNVPGAYVAPPATAGPEAESERRFTVTVTGLVGVIEPLLRLRDST